MPNIITNQAAKVRRFSTAKKVWLGIAAVVLILILYHFLHHKKTDYQFIPVTQGSITETVSVTGNTTPMQNVSIGFQTAGTIARVDYALGDTVPAGAVVAELNTAGLSASLAEAQATVSAAQAQLDGLQAGPQSQNVAVSQTALTTAQANLTQITNQEAVLVANAYRSLLNSTITARSTNTTTLTPPTITGTYTGTTEGTLTISLYTTSNSGYFSLGGLATGTGNINPSSPVPLGDTGLYIQVPYSSTYNGTTWVVTIPDTTAANYLANYNAYQQALQTQSQTVASAQAAVSQAQAQLNLTQAGSTTQAIAAQQAQVQQAQAQVSSAEANLQNAEIIAPISGVLTQMDAKVGQQATPGTPLVSIIGNGGFEVDAGVSETDVGKLATGDTVSMTLDAFPGETFTGSVFYIAPAQTDTNGVITYLAKISFDKADPRLKSGLTANLDIETNHKDSVLILPQYAILLNDQGTFVETVANNVVKQIPVTLGIQDENGNVEITSGVTAGEQVLNIGLKT